MRKLENGDPKRKNRGKKKGKDHKTSSERPYGTVVAKATKKDVELGKKPTERPLMKEGKKKKRQKMNERDGKPIVENRSTSDQPKHHGDTVAAKPGPIEGLTALQITMKSSLEGAHFR